MTKNSPIRDLIDLMELEEYKKVLEERNKNKDKKPSKWWWTNPIKLWLILVLLYPFAGKVVGKLYLTLLQ